MSSLIQPFLKTINEYFEDSVNCIVSVLPDDASSSVKRFAGITRDMIRYNASGGKKIRACLFLAAYNALHPCEEEHNSGDHPCEKHVMNNKPAAMLACAIELLQASFLVADDIMDRSMTRRGLPCWYVKVAERNGLDGSESFVTAGSAAINDAFILCNGSWRLVNMFFTGDLHWKIMCQMQDTFLQTAVGQHIDMDKTVNSVEKCLSADFSDKTALKSLAKALEERYWSTVLYKTALYSFRLPLVLAYILAQANSASAQLPNFDKLVELSCRLGRIFQMQDDMLDWVVLDGSNKTQLTDIAEGKLSWPFLKALQVTIETDDKEGFLILKEYYGRENDQQPIVQLYQKLDIQALFTNESEQMRAEFRRATKELQHDLIENVLLNFLDLFCSSV